MIHLIKIFILIGIVISISACEKEFIIITETEEEQEETIPLVNTTIRGNVFDKNTLPLSNVIIELMVNGSSFANSKSKSNGEFSLVNIPANTDRSLLITRHPDYATSYQRLNIKEDIIQYAELTLDKKSSIEFSANELITFSDSNIEVEIMPNSFTSGDFNSVILDINTLDKSILKNKQFFPKIAIPETNEILFLDHQLAFQLSAVNNNNEELSIASGVEYEVDLKSSDYDPESTIWYFDVKESVWKQDESSYFEDNSTLILSKIGLISIAKAKELFSFAGQLVDDNGKPLAFAKLIITDIQNNIVNQVFTNSLGEYLIELPENVSGKIIVSIDNNDVETIPFNDIKDSSLSVITIANSISCNDIELEPFPFSCESALMPEQLFNFDISSYSNFIMTINGAQSLAASSTELFSNINWQSLVNETLPYTISFQDQNNSTQECNGTITLKSKSNLNAICIDNLTIKLGDKDSAVLFAEDVNEASPSNPCQDDIMFLIARADQCGAMCDTVDFNSSVTFTRDDLDKTIQYILRVTDNQNAPNECFGSIFISN